MASKMILAYSYILEITEMKVSMIRKCYSHRPETKPQYIQVIDTHNSNNTIKVKQPANTKLSKTSGLTIIWLKCSLGDSPPRLFWSHREKVRTAGKIRNQYNQVPHLTQDTTWESDKPQLNITNKSQESQQVTCLRN